MASRPIPRLASADAQLNNRIVGFLSSERLVLVVLFVFLVVFYGAIGRDVFFNRLYMTKATLNDPIGTVLPYLRMLTCMGIIVLVSYSAGVNWTFSKIPWMFAPFAALALASAMWADDPKEAFRDAAVMSMLWVAMPVLMYRMGLLLVVQVSLFIISWVVILSFFVAIVFPHIGVHDGQELRQASHVGQWRGIFSHKNALGPWAAYASVFLFTHGWLCKGNRVFFWIAKCCGLVCLAKCGSVTGIVAAICLAGMHVMFLLLRRFGMATTVAISLLLFLAAIVLVASGGIDVAFKLLGRDATFTGRTGIWQMGWSYAWDQPWLGHGYQMDGGAKLLNRTFVLFGQQLSPESGYLTLVLDMGFVGCVLFAIPLVIALRNGLEWMPFVSNKDRACIEYLLMLMIVSLVQSFSDANVLICVGFDGILSFSAFFGLMALPNRLSGRCAANSDWRNIRGSQEGGEWEARTPRDCRREALNVALADALLAIAKPTSS